MSNPIRFGDIPNYVSRAAYQDVCRERDAAVALVLDYVNDGVVFFDCENAAARQDDWLARAQALLGEKDGAE